MQGMHYRAIDDKGTIHFGFMNASTTSELREQIAQRGWRLLPESIVQRIANVLHLQPRMARWSKSSASLFAMQLSQLLAARVSLTQALAELEKLEERKQIRLALSDLRSNVEQGCSLGGAMADYPGLFGPEYIASIRAGEASGQTVQSLENLAENLRWQSELSEKLKTVLAYPLFALASLVTVFLFVLLYLVPAMLPLLSDSTVPLPAHTKILIAFSDGVRSLGVGFLALIVFLISIFSILILLGLVNKSQLHGVLLHGIYGRIMLNFSLARYAKATSMLYESGVEITEAMNIGEQMVGNTALRSQLTNARSRILSGSTAADAMQSQSRLPALFVRMIAAGEYAGVLGVSLRQCSYQLQGSAQYSQSIVRSVR